MKDTWFADIEPRLFTIFKKRMKESFPNVFYTTANENVKESKFPCVLFHEIGQEEIGQDLDNVTVNAVRSTIQVQVYSKKAAECKEVTSAAVAQLKQLRYNIASMPIYNSERGGEIHFSAIRAHRVIGGGDIDIVPR